MTVEEIKSAYTISDVLQKYGIRVGANGFCKCPLHKGDNTASFKIYPETNTYHCFGCGKSGDIIRFVEDYLSCDFRTAFEELGGTYEKPTTLREKREQVARIRELQRRKRELARRKEEAARAKRNICTALTYINRALEGAEVFSQPWTNLINEKAMLHDALMQLAEGRTLEDGVFPAGIKRYI